MLGKIKDRLLDQSIFFSFDSTGFKRHKKYFKDFDENLPTKPVLVTGGTSGIGLAVANHLLEKGIQCTIFGRNPKKFFYHQKASFHSIDLSQWDQISQFVKEAPAFSHLVFNAGGMPENFTKNSEGQEYQFASQLLGHYLLFLKLHEQGKLSPGAKIIFVSSGGMLLKKLHLDELWGETPYNKVQCYANVKRAQVILVEELAKEFPQYCWSSMHPGWVNTETVQKALPTFFKITKNRLRTPEEGADTILFLLFGKNLPSGNFWFDRAKSESYPFNWTKETVEERRIFMEEVNNLVKVKTV